MRSTSKESALIERQFLEVSQFPSRESTRKHMHAKVRSDMALSIHEFSSRTANKFI
jgi:hypothetical protein